MKKGRTEKTQTEKFLELLEPVLERLERFSLYLTRNRDEARDLVGETILDAWNGFGGLRNNEAFLSYLFTIASRKFHSGRRKSGRFVSTDPVSMDELLGESVDPADLADINALYDALGRLGPEEKEAIILFHIMGFTQKEIAAIQNCSPNNVKQRIHRGLIKLREILVIDIKSKR